MKQSWEKSWKTSDLKPAKRSTTCSERPGRCTSGRTGTRSPVAPPQHVSAMKPPPSAFCSGFDQFGVLTRNLREARDSAVLEKDRAVAAERDSQSRYDQLLEQWVWLLGFRKCSKRFHIVEKLVIFSQQTPRNESNSFVLACLLVFLLTPFFSNRAEAICFANQPCVMSLRAPIPFRPLNNEQTCLRIYSVSLGRLGSLLLHIFSICLQTVLLSVLLFVIRSAPKCTAAHCLHRLCQWGVNQRKWGSLHPRPTLWISHQSVHIFLESRLTVSRFAILTASLWDANERLTLCLRCSSSKWKGEPIFLKGASMHWSGRTLHHGWTFCGKGHTGSARSILVATGVTGPATCLKGAE